MPKKICYSTSLISISTLIGSFLCLTPSFAQNVGINSTGATPQSSSILDLNSGNTFTSPNGKGLLIPNIALTSILDITTINSPATSLLVYNTTTAGTSPNNVTPGYYYWNGIKWIRFANSIGGVSGTAWDINGNSGTSAGSNFIGTTDAQDVVFKTNNTQRWSMTQSGIPELKANASNLLISKTGAGNTVIGYNNTNAGIVLGDNNNNFGGSSDIVIGNNNSTAGGGPLNTIVLGSNFNSGGGGPINSVFIGNNINLGGSGPINSVYIGNSSMSWIGGQVNWSVYSDKRLKENIKDYTLGLDFILKLQPKSYSYSESKSRAVYNGLLAQDVEATLNELNAHFSGLCRPQNNKDYYSLRYAEFVIPLINAVKEQQALITKLEDTVSKMQEELNALKKQKH